MIFKSNGILVVIVFIILDLKIIQYSNTNLIFFADFIIVVLGILIVSFINVKPTKKHEVFVERAWDLGILSILEICLDCFSILFY